MSHDYINQMKNIIKMCVTLVKFSKTVVIENLDYNAGHKHNVSTQTPDVYMYVYMGYSTPNRTV